ncbi:hypothetical protein Tco_0059882, partial [Tanacetum coccineum]
YGTLTTQNSETPVNRVHVLDFAGLTEEMRQTLADRLRMVYTGDKRHELMSDTEMGLDVADTLCFQLGGARRRMTWRQFIIALGLDTVEEMAEDGFEAYWLGSTRVIPDKGDLRDYWTEISSDRDFLGPAPSYIYIRDHVRRLCHMLISCIISGRGQAPEKVTSTDLFYLRSMDQGTVNVPYLLAQYLFRHAEGRKSRARMSVGHFIGRLADHFGLVSDEGLMGFSVITRVLLVIDLHQLSKFNICVRLGDTWAWVALGPERQQVAAAGALKVAEGAPIVDDGVLAPMQAPQPPPALARTIAQRLSVLEEEVHNLRSDVGEQKGVLDNMDHDFSRFTTWTVTSLSRATSEWFKKDCIGLVTTWEDLEEKSVQKFYHLSYNNDEIEADEDDNPEDIAEIFKIESNLFDFETPLCKAFNEFNYLLKIDTDLFTFDIQEIRTYEEHEYELNNNMTRDLEEP